MGGVRAFIGLGANLGDAKTNVLLAMQAIAALPSTMLRSRSSLYRSKPVDAGGPDFINAVIEVETDLCAPALLHELQSLEHAAGRQRPYPNAPRTLDLDLLLYGDASINSPTLVIPHPRMGQRAFVLLPLAEIAPDRVHDSALQATCSQLVERLSDGTQPARQATSIRT